ncbi:MAG TPA: hypothetical protein VF148_17540 [Acidimicrobiia bacterium]
MPTLRILSGSLGVVALIELALLRTGTRTLVHIPGLGRFDLSIGLLSEVGRLAYYFSVVLLFSTLVYLVVWLWRVDTLPARAASVFTSFFLLVAGAGRIDVLTVPVVGWCSLIATLAVATVTWRGVSSIPIGLFTASWAIAAWSVLGQGVGGGLSGRSVDVSILVAESLLILAGVTAPLLVRRGVGTPGLVAGLVAFLAVAVGFSVGGSTLAILALWNLGVPGWFSPLAFGLAFGGLVTATWSALAAHERLTAVSIGLLVAGGVGTISTYQTGLVVAAIAIYYVANLASDTETDHLSARLQRTSPERKSREAAPAGRGERVGRALARSGSGD